MCKLPPKLRKGHQTCKGKPANGWRKGLPRIPKFSKKCLLSILRMQLWHIRRRARFCFFSTPRKGIKHKRRSARPSSSCGRLRDVKMQWRIKGDTDSDRKMSEQNTPDREQGPTSSGGDDAGERQGGCGEACPPASPSTSRPGDCPPQTPTADQTSNDCQRRQGAAGGSDPATVDAFEKSAVDQKPRSDPACITMDTEQVTNGETGSGTSPSPVSESLPEAGVPSDGQQEPAVSNKALISTIKEFLSGFYKAYGSLIPLQKCDLPQCLRLAGMDARKRNIAISVMTKYNSTLVRRSPPFSVVYKKHTVTLEDLSTLAQQNWLNDQVINMYGELIMESTDKKVHFLNSFFHHQLETKGYEGVKRWTKQVNLFASSLLLVPVHLEVHWCLVVVDPQQRSVRLYDSSECTSPPEVTLGIRKYLIREAEEKSQKHFQTGWVVSANKKTPQQNNENDCGVFVLEYCKRLALRRPLAFSQEKIPSIRKRIYKELCERKLHV